MIKLKTGAMFGKPGTGGNEQEVVIPVSSPIGLKDALIGSGIVMVGVAYLIYAAYENGAKAFERGELYKMKELGIIDWDPVDVLDRKWKWSVK